MAFSKSPDPVVQPVQPIQANGKTVATRPMVNQPGASKSILRSLDEKGNAQAQSKGKMDMTNKIPRKFLIGGVVVLLLAGVGTGFAADRFLPGKPTLQDQLAQVQREEEISSNQVTVGAVFGVPDEKTFKDTTSGVLIKGGLDGEGSHTLLREGGISQNVYLTSSVVDLDQFENMEVKVWGETFKGQKAGWLMDIGRVEVVNTSATKPSWYEESAQ